MGSLTDYPSPLHGPRLLSFQRHGQLERLSFLLFLGLPCVTRTGRDRAYFLGVLAAYLGVQLLTDWDPRRNGRGP